MLGLRVSVSSVNLWISVNMRTRSVMCCYEHLLIRVNTKKRGNVWKRGSLTTGQLTVITSASNQTTHRKEKSSGSDITMKTTCCKLSPTTNEDGKERRE